MHDDLAKRIAVHMRKAERDPKLCALLTEAVNLAHKAGYVSSQTVALSTANKDNPDPVPTPTPEPTPTDPQP